VRVKKNPGHNPRGLLIQIVAPCALGGAAGCGRSQSCKVGGLWRVLEGDADPHSMAMAAFGYRIEPLSEMAANAREVAQRSTFAIPAITPAATRLMGRARWAVTCEEDLRRDTTDAAHSARDQTRAAHRGDLASGEKPAL